MLKLLVVEMTAMPMMMVTAMAMSVTIMAAEVAATAEILKPKPKLITVQTIVKR